MKISIQKYDPLVDAAPYFVEHEVPFVDKMTLLEAVIQIHESGEYIAFDYSCHGRHCGRCAVMLNGVPVLMCATPITDKSHKVEPLKGHPIIRDLIVEKSAYHAKLAQNYFRVRTEAIAESEINEFDGKAAVELQSLVRCMRCGICDAACPVRSEMPAEYAGPSTMISLAFRHYDSYDQANRLLEAVSKGMYRCILCGTCDAVCQRFEIEHVKTWEKLRDEAQTAGLKPSYA